MRRISVLSIILCLSLSVLPWQAIADQTISFATAQEWRRGTGSVFNDVLALETTIENPYATKIAPLGDSMAPANVFGDNFRTDSADGETFRWRKATSCSQSSGSDVTITDDDVFFNYSTFSTKIDTGDGAMVMKHRHGDLTQLRNSTRSTPAPVDNEARNFVDWSMTISWTGFTSANNSTTNKARLFLVNQVNHGASRILCGGFGSGAINGFGWILEVRTVGSIYVQVQPYVVQSGVTSFCEKDLGFPGAGFGTMTNIRLRVQRQGTSIRFYINDNAVAVCPSPWDGPLWSVFDFQTKSYPGAMLVIHDTSDSWIAQRQTDPNLPTDTFLVASPISESNWTTPTFGDGTQIVKEIHLYFAMSIPGASITVCSLTLKNANTGAIIWVTPFCFSFTTLGEFPKVFIPSTHPKVPFKFFFEMRGDVSTHYGALQRLDIILSDSVLPPITPGKAGPAEVLVGIIAPCAVFLLIGLLFLLASLMSVRRLKGG